MVVRKSGLIAIFLLPKGGCCHHLSLYIMNKYLRALIGLSIVVLFSTTKVHAGFVDWIVGSKDSRADSFMFVGSSMDLPQISDIHLPTIQDNSIAQSTVASQESVKKQSVKSAAKARYTVSVSAYSSTPDQTDDSPFITANGTYVHDGIVATNFLPFGTAIKIPEMFGDKVFVVTDRMNRRYATNVDVWMADRMSALQFGRRTLTIEVL